MEPARPFLPGVILNAGLGLIGLAMTLFVGGAGLMFSPGITGEWVAHVVACAVVLVAMPVVGLVGSLQGGRALSFLTAAVCLLGLVVAAGLYVGLFASPFAAQPVSVEAPDPG